MNFELTDEQRMLQEGAARYFATSYGFEKRLERARNEGGFSRDTWSEFASMGWLAAAVPEEHGGLGFGPIEIALIAEEVGRALVLEPFTACGVLPASIIRRVVPSERAGELLASLASGDAIFAVALSEPGARGFLEGIECRATRVTGGGWRLDGRKSLVIGAPIADQLLVVARVADHAGPTDDLGVFLIDPNTPGVTLQSCALMDGTPTADLHLDSVTVEAESLLGSSPSTRAALQLALDEAIVVQCAEVVGAAEDVLSLCADYLKSRKQFGVPIGSFQALQHRMADMAIESSQARASLHRGLQLLTTGCEDSLSVDVSGVKAQVVKSVRYITQQGIQLHGGYGITEEYRVGHHWRRMLLVDATFGSAAQHLTRYAERRT